MPAESYILRIYRRGSTCAGLVVHAASRKQFAFRSFRELETILSGRTNNAPGRQRESAKPNGRLKP